MDTPHRFVREYVENGVLRITYIFSDKNQADPFTKNVTSKKIEELREVYQSLPEVFDTKTKPPVITPDNAQLFVETRAHSGINILHFLRV